MQQDTERGVPGGDAFFFEYAKGLAGHCGGGIDYPHIRPRDAAYQRHKEGIVGAAQHQGVGTGVKQGLHGAPYRCFGLGTVQDAVFHQFYEALAYTLHHFDVTCPSAPGIQVFAALESTCRSQYADNSASGSEGGGLDGGLHPHEGNGGVFLTQEGYCGGGGCIAGDDDYIGPFIQEEIRDGDAPFAYILHIFGAVGAVGVVGEIDIMLFGEQFHHFPIDRQTAGTGIIQADCCHSYANIQDYFVFL